MEKKRTAVDYLKEKFITIHWFLVRDEISRAQADDMLKKSFEQAKEIEKDQIKDAWLSGQDDGATICTPNQHYPDEDYYNETYKKQQNEL